MATDRLNQEPELFITCLRNAHAMEKQALVMMKRQIDRLEHYPQLAEWLCQHVAQTNGQIARLDEILKTTFSSFTFEDFEIASHMSLIAMAEVDGSPSIPTLDQSLRKERAMTDWIEDNVVMITRRYVDLSASGQPAKI